MNASLIIIPSIHCQTLIQSRVTGPAASAASPRLPFPRPRLIIIIICNLKKVVFMKGSWGWVGCGWWGKNGRAGEKTDIRWVHAGVWSQSPRSQVAQWVSPPGCRSKISFNQIVLRGITEIDRSPHRAYTHSINEETWVCLSYWIWHRDYILSET